MVLLSGDKKYKGFKKGQLLIFKKTPRVRYKTEKDFKRHHRGPLKKVLPSAFRDD